MKSSKELLAEYHNALFEIGEKTALKKEIETQIEKLFTRIENILIDYKKAVKAEKAAEAPKQEENNKEASVLPSADEKQKFENE